VIPSQNIAESILILRGRRIVLDTALAAVYGVTTKRFNEQVRRNRTRFPPDFMFQLTGEEQLALRSHFATSNNDSFSLDASAVQISAEALSAPQPARSRRSGSSPPCPLFRNTHPDSSPDTAGHNPPHWESPREPRSTSPSMLIRSTTAAVPR